MKLKGRMWILNDDDINTDVIYPGKYTYELFDEREMASHALEDYDPSFAEQVEDGDIIIAGGNFGCGSSREQAVKTLKYAGVKAIIAASFARIYYRNAINQALYAIECPEASQYARDHREKLEKSEATLDLEKGTVMIGEKEFSFSPLSGKAQEIFDAGGLVPYTRKKLEK
ncbi:MAG: 3-isopropylmalate dehydratase [Candidatus Latescibacteria bacterium]|nr:3-isopropylmalate dehydratase [bacterium]MBD3424442.1 3-isopropylmalate dehydratase [Candidatus Latescibacterota bacterium]